MDNNNSNTEHGVESPHIVDDPESTTSSQHYNEDLQYDISSQDTTTTVTCTDSPLQHEVDTVSCDDTVSPPLNSDDTVILTHNDTLHCSNNTPTPEPPAYCESGPRTCSPKIVTGASKRTPPSLVHVQRQPAAIPSLETSTAIGRAGSPPPIYCLYQETITTAEITPRPVPLPEYYSMNEPPPPYQDWQGKLERQQAPPTQRHTVPVTTSTVHRQQPSSSERYIIGGVPQPSTLRHYNSVHGAAKSDHYMTVSLILTILCFFSCGYLWLFCTIPAFILSSKAIQAESDGNMPKARRYGRVSLCLNAITILSWLLFWVGIIIFASSTRQSSHDSSSSRYYYYYHH